MRAPTVVRRFVVTGLFLLFTLTAARAQFGFGAGVAALGENVLDASNNLLALADNDTIGYTEIGGTIGAYAMAKFTYSYGSNYRLNLDVSYVFFPAQEIRMVDHSLEDTSGTFEVGASLIPVAFGMELFVPSANVRPYFGAQVTYTVIHKTFVYVDGSREFDREDVRNEWEGQNEFGLALRGGVELALGKVALDLGLRYNMANLITNSEEETAMNYLQVGVAVMFGDLLNSDSE